jgi:hypothetical protein
LWSNAIDQVPDTAHAAATAALKWTSIHSHSKSGSNILSPNPSDNESMSSRFSSKQTTYQQSPDFKTSQRDSLPSLLSRAWHIDVFYCKSKPMQLRQEVQLILALNRQSQ